jgi:transposase
MQLLFACCAALDVHKRQLVACLLRTFADGRQEKTLRHFGTTLRELAALRDWLVQSGCQIVAMESTGPYWWPIYNVLEGHLEQWVVNAYHCKNVPGRKTDLNDAEWLAELLRYGLLKPSFVPGREQRDLRELTRTRSELMAERARCSQRLQQVLEDANIKLAAVLTDITGASGRAMLAALRDGETDATVLAQLARGKLQKRWEELVPALEGRVRETHRCLLGQWLRQLSFLDEQVAALDVCIAAHLTQMSGPLASGDSAEGAPAVEPAPATGNTGAAGGSGTRPETATPGSSGRQGLPPSTPLPYCEAVSLLDPIPGLAVHTSQAILAEIGVDMRRFPSDRHLTAWAGVAPGNHQSAGKRGPSRCRPGNPALRKALVQAAHGAIRTKGSYFNALYHRLAFRRGRKRAIIAVARSLLVVIYHVLLYQEPYRELGSSYHDERNQEALVNGMRRRLERLGYQVQLTPPAAAAA